MNFIGDQRGVVLRGQLARALPECFADRENAAFALNRFDHEGADGVVEFRFEVGDIVEADEFDAGNQRRKRLAVFRRMRDRKRAERAAVKRIFKRQNARLRRARRWRAILRARRRARVSARLRSLRCRYW